MSAELVWKRMGTISLESATVGFGDAEVRHTVEARPDIFRDTSCGEPLKGIQDWHATGLPFIAVETGEDGEYPVERGLDELGIVRALRVEFVTDLESVDGRWQAVGHVSIRTGRCIVADPYCLQSNPGLYSIEVDAPNGDQRVEVFYSQDDRLGMRVLFNQ